MVFRIAKIQSIVQSWFFDVIIGLPEYLEVLVSYARGSGSRCDNFFLQLAEISLWIFPKDLNNEMKNMKQQIYFIF